MKPIWQQAVLGLVLFASGCSTQAAGPEASATGQLDRCTESAGTADLAVKDCYVELANREDQRLNRNWERLLNAVGGTQTEVGAALQTEQRAWIAFKEVACMHYSVAGGTLDRLQGQMCYTDLLTRRADELAELAELYGETPVPN